MGVLRANPERVIGIIVRGAPNLPEAKMITIRFAASCKRFELLVIVQAIYLAVAILLFQFDN